MLKSTVSMSLFRVARTGLTQQSLYHNIGVSWFCNQTSTHTSNIEGIDFNFQHDSSPASNIKVENGKWKVPVVSICGKPVDTVDLDPYVFGAPIRGDVMHRVVVWQLAKRRQGTAKGKNRSDVRGSTKKIFSQKGRGAARHSTRKANIFVGGGKAFPPVPRDFGYTLPKKVRRMGLRSALATKLAQGKLIVIDHASLESHRTKLFVEKISETPWANQTATILTGEKDSNKEFELATRNLFYYRVIPFGGANVYTILRQKYLLVTRECVKLLEQRLAEYPSDHQLFEEEQEEEEGVGADVAEPVQ